MPDFEALGRYVTLKETIEKLYQERLGKISALQQIFQMAARPLGGSEILDLDTHPAELLLTELRDINHRFMTAIHELNSYADRAGKPKFIVRKHPAP